MAELGITNDADPYVCFRQREIKMLRKARRSDNQTIEKLRRLRDEMHKAREIMELIHERETVRLETLELEQEIFEKRVIVRKLRKKLGVTAERDVDLSPDRNRKKIHIRKTMGMEERFKIIDVFREPTKIKLSLHKFKDSQDDSKVYVEQVPFIDSLMIEGRIKRKRLADERECVLDMTEVSFVIYLKATAIG